MASAEIKRHWAKVADMGCIITGNPECELHHCFAGSMSDHGINRGLSKKVSDYLVIPLSYDLHRGMNGIHSGVISWENFNGTQIKHLYHVSTEIGIDVFEKAGYWYDKEADRFDAI